MKVTLTRDTSLIQRVITLLFDETTQDDDKLSNMDWRTFSDPEQFFYVVTKQDALAGLVHFTYYTDKLVEMHMNMLKGFRGEFAHKAGQSAIRQFKSQLPGVQLITFVPSYYTNVVAFVEQNGFVAVKTLPNTFKKNGKVYSTEMFVEMI